MKIDKERGDPIDVTWIDTVGISGWLDFSDAMRVNSRSLCRTRGFYIGENESFLVIACTMSDGDCNGVTQIPLGWLVEVK